MSVKTYSKSKDGATKLSENFKVSEFACKDNSDVILIDERLPKILEHIRASLVGRPVAINSAYRNESYNAKIGGAKASQHILGTAADICIGGVKPIEICKVAEEALASFGIKGGIGLYGGKAGEFTHVDVRANRSRWEKTTRTGNLEVTVSGWGSTASASGGAELSPPPTLKRGSTGLTVCLLQTKLNAEMGLCLAPDGNFGAKTEAAVKNFQTAKKLTADGVVGVKTWAALG